MSIYNGIDSRVYFYILGLEYECNTDQRPVNYMLEAVCMAKGHRLGGTTIMLDQAQLEIHTSKGSEE
jgi:hypothetical protein